MIDRLPVPGCGRRLTALSRAGLSCTTADGPPLSRRNATLLLGVGPVGFDVAYRLVGGASHGAWPVVALDGQLGVVDVDGDGLAGVDPAEGDPLSGDCDGAGRPW
jgi:hypothetical protein